MPSEKTMICRGWRSTSPRITARSLAGEHVPTRLGMTDRKCDQIYRATRKRASNGQEEEKDAGYRREDHQAC
jgi:hypothetical protein